MYLCVTPQPGKKGAGGRFRGELHGQPAEEEEEEEKTSHSCHLRCEWLFVSVFFLWIHFPLLNCSVALLSLYVHISYEFLLTLSCGFGNTRWGNCCDNKTTSTLILQTDRLTDTQVNALFSLQSSQLPYDLFYPIFRCLKLKLNTIMRQPIHSPLFPA